MRKRIEINDGDDDCKTVLSPEQGLMLLLSFKLTEKQYEFTQKFFKSLGHYILPCYIKVREAKNDCRPGGIHYTETNVEVSL
jgi:S-adenosylmethionine:tRNA-ribosyltransferase-isomerase (queuine synthetase)